MCIYSYDIVFFLFFCSSSSFHLYSFFFFFSFFCDGFTLSQLYFLPSDKELSDPLMHLDNECKKNVLESCKIAEKAAREESIAVFDLLKWKDGILKLEAVSTNISSSLVIITSRLLRKWVNILPKITFIFVQLMSFSFSAPSPSLFLFVELPSKTQWNARKSECIAKGDYNVSNREARKWSDENPSIRIVVNKI